MNQIDPYRIWIGHAGDGRDFREVFAKEIRAIVQLAAEESPLQPPRELMLYRFPLMDGVGNDLDLFQLAIGSVAALLKRDIPTLVCCSAGMSRSPAIVAAALSMAHPLTLEDCLNRVTTCRPVDLSPGFWLDVRSALKSGSFLNRQES